MQQQWDINTFYYFISTVHRLQFDFFCTLYINNPLTLRGLLCVSVSSDTASVTSQLRQPIRYFPFAFVSLQSCSYFSVPNTHQFVLTQIIKRQLNSGIHFWVPHTGSVCSLKYTAGVHSPQVSNIQSHRNNRGKFKNKLHRYIITHSFYSVTEFLECKIDKEDI
jgi:hypothetical protein